MALSLAACGGSSTPVVVVEDDAAVADPVVDAAKALTLQISSVTGTFDNLEGGSGADTFTAGSGALETGDAIDGKGGADTLTATYTADASVIATVANVETINVRAYGNDVDVTLDMDGISGATSVNAFKVDNVTAANSASVTVTNLALGTDVGVVGGAAAAASAGDVTFTFKSTTGTSDAATVNLDAALVNDVTIAGIETLTINSGGASANLLADLVAANASTINVTGSQDLTITAEVDMADTSVVTTGAIDGTVDASAMTGALSFTPNASDNMKITGGSGNDTFAMTTGLDKYDILDGGAGTDTVSITAVADDASLDLSTYSFTNIEVMSVEGATGLSGDPTDITIAADAAGISTLTLVEPQAHADGDAGDVSTFTVTGLTSGNSINLVNNKEDTTATDYSQIGAVTLSLLDGSGVSDNLTVTLKGTTGQTAEENTVTDLAVTDVETLNIVSSHTGTTAASVLTATDDNTLGDISTDTKLTTLNISGSDQASITVGSEATKLATVNTAGMSNDLSLTLAATVDQTVTGGSAKETVAMGSTLNNADTVDLAGGTDVLSATVTGLTATTGALKISNVETLNLTNGGTAVIDATAITGASEIAILTNTTKATITGLAADTAVGLGINDTDGDVDGIVDVALADATGTADTLTVNLNDTAEGNATGVDLRTTGVETVALVYTDTTDTALANTVLDVDAINAATLTVKGANGDVGHTLGLGTLDTDTKTVDASGYYGIMTVTAGADTATSITARGDAAHVITGSTKNDTFVISGATTNALVGVDGNGGTDTLSMVLGTGAQDFDKITDVDTINFTSTGTVAITTDGDSAALDGINEATKVTFSGGNSISTVTLGGSNDVLTDTVSAVLDFSGFNGKLADATWAVDDFDNDVAGKTIQVIGSALKDTVSASYDSDATTAVQINMQGVEVFDVAMADGAAEVRFDMSLVTGLTNINVTDTSSELVEFYNMAAGTTVDVTTTNATATQVEVVLADATGTTDSQTFVVDAVDAGDNVKLTTLDIETLSISSGSANQVDLELSGVTMTGTKTASVVFTGTNDIELATTSAAITTIDASGMGTGGAIVQTGRTGTDAATYTGSAGNDTFIMMNAADVIDGGAGTGDTLDVNMTQAVGTAIFDLSSTTDQMTSFNGGANATVVKGFENLDLAGVLTNGSVVTGSSAANTITGSGLVDQIDGGAGDDIIDGGAGNDVINGGAGGDTITAGTGNDTINLGTGGSDIVVFGAFAANGFDTVTNFDSTADTLNFLAHVDAHATADVTQVAASASTDGEALVDNHIYVVDFGDSAIASKDFAVGDFADIFGAAKFIGVDDSTLAAGTAAVVIVKGNDQSHVLFVEGDANDVTAADVNFVATLDVLRGESLTTADFVVA